MYNGFEKWIEKILYDELPEATVALNFNLYENEGHCWSIELVGTASFDEEDEDWVCDEVFNTRDRQLTLSRDTTWEVIQNEVVNVVERYLENGPYADILKEYKGIGVGFVDGDIEIVYRHQ